MSQSLFRSLHVPGDPFIMANVWDAGSARMMAALGAKALASSSAAHAFTLGRSDLGHVGRDEALHHAASLVLATPLPVSGDLENGFGHRPEDVAQTVKLAAAAGLAGCGIEDIALPDTTPYDFDQAVDRIAAAADAARASAGDFVLTARADGVMHGRYDVAEAIRRLNGFAEAGADVLFAPVLPDLDALRLVCRSVDRPVNVLCTGALTKISLSEFAEIGVARISLGSSLARAVHKVIENSGRAMFTHGDFSPLGQVAKGAEVDEMLAQFDDLPRK